MKIWDEIWDYVKMIIFVVVVVLIVNNVVLINAKIPSESMEKTIMTGDRIFGFRMAYGVNLDLFGNKISKKVKDPERYDVIIFKFPDDESQLFIKRLIGLPGETVEIINGEVYINGEKQEQANSYVPEMPVGSYGPVSYTHLDVYKRQGLKKHAGYEIVSLEGGQKDNAITRESIAVLMVEKDEVERVKAYAADIQQKLRIEYTGTDENITIAVSYTHLDVYKRQKLDCPLDI